MHQQHLGSRLARYCRGKYKWVGNSEHYIGKEVPMISVCYLYIPVRYHTEWLRVFPSIQ
ncbi:DUF987 family protein [Providencia stuartii]